MDDQPIKCSAPIEIAPRRFVNLRCRAVRRIQRNSQVAVDLRLHFGGFHERKLQSDPQIELNVDVVDAGSPILVVFRHLTGSEQHQLLPLELRGQAAGILLSLIEIPQLDGGESLPLIVSPSLDLVVVDADALVRVANRQIHRQVVVQRAVVDVKLGELRAGGVEFDGVGAEDQPQDEDDDPDDDENSEDDLADAGADAVHDAAAAAAEGVAAASASVAAGAVVVLRRRRNGGAVVGPIQVRLSGFSHWRGFEQQRIFFFLDEIEKLNRKKSEF